MTREELENTMYALLKVLPCRVFKQDVKDPKFQGEYVEIIPLVVDESSFDSDSVINVNVHVPDSMGVKNTTKISELSSLVRPLFRTEKDAEEHYYTFLNGVHLSIESAVDYKDDNGTHYRNFRIILNYLNT